MKISSVHLRNMKCHKELNLPLGSITLLSGLNGGGKSSCAQSLLLMRQSQEQDELSKGRLALNGDLVSLGLAKDVLYEDAESDTVSFGIGWSDGQRVDLNFDYQKAQDILWMSKPPALIDRLPFAGDIHYASADRVGPRSAWPISDYTVQVLEQMGTRGEYVPHYLSVYGRNRLDRKKTLHPKAESLTLHDQVVAWLREISPGISLSVTEHRAIDSVQLAYYYSGAYGPGLERRPGNVGFGVTYALPIITAALAAKPGSLLIVENPEAHLHPKAQVKLTGLLAKAARDGVQVLIETHSDHVLNGLRLAVLDKVLDAPDVRIHFFVYQSVDDSFQSVVTSPTIDAQGRISEWPKGFFDEIDLALDRLL